MKNGRHHVTIAGNIGVGKSSDEGVPERHGIEIDHEAAAAQHEQASQSDYEWLDFAEVNDEALERPEAQAEGEHHRPRGERVPSDRVESFSMSTLR